MDTEDTEESRLSDEEAALPLVSPAPPRRKPTPNGHRIFTVLLIAAFLALVALCQRRRAFKTSLYDEGERLGLFMGISSCMPVCNYSEEEGFTPRLVSQGPNTICGTPGHIGQVWRTVLPDSIIGKRKCFSMCDDNIACHGVQWTSGALSGGDAKCDMWLEPICSIEQAAVSSDNCLTTPTTTEMPSTSSLAVALPDLHCNSSCVHGNSTRTCTEVVERLTESLFQGERNACGQAYSKMRTLCPACGSCSVEDTGCEVEPEPVHSRIRILDFPKSAHTPRPALCRPKSECLKKCLAPVTSTSSTTPTPDLGHRAGWIGMLSPERARWPSSANAPALRDWHWSQFQAGSNTTTTTSTGLWGNLSDNGIYDADGYDKYGFDKDGYDRKGYDIAGPSGTGLSGSRADKYRYDKLGTGISYERGKGTKGIQSAGEFQCDLVCTSRQSSDKVDLVVPGNVTRASCARACNLYHLCNAIVYAEHPPSCHGIRGPTSRMSSDEWDDIYTNWLRPLPGVQLGDCTPPYPRSSELPPSCTKPEPYEWGQKTVFFTSRPPPWGKCAIFGDPYVIPFDRPRPSHSCPILGRAWENGMDTVQLPGVYNLVSIPKGSAESLLVQGKFGFTQDHSTRSSMQGVAVSGSFVGGHELVVEYKTSGSDRLDFTITWDGQQILRKLPDTFKDDARHPTISSMYTTADAFMQGFSAPLYVFKIFRAATADEFMRIYVVVMSPQVINTIISLQKTYEHEQDGLCGNFDCNLKDDSIEHTSSGGLKNVSTSSNLFAEFTAQLLGTEPDAQGSQFSMTESEELCKKVSSGLQMGCAMDVAYARREDRQAVVERYKLLGTLWEST